MSKIFLGFYRNLIFGTNLDIIGDMDILEQFVDLKDYDLPYKVSNTGKITVLGREIGLSLNKDGYLSCRLRLNGGYVRRTVHRLVAHYFVPNPDNKPEVHHVNFIKTDNNCGNLLWCTSAENNSYNKNNPYLKRGEKWFKFKGWYEIDGKKYTSTREASVDVGISRQTVLDRCSSSEFPNYNFIKKPSN